VETRIILARRVAGDDTECRELTAIGSETPGVIFDDSGEAWPAQSAQLVERLGHSADHVGVIANAVKNLGFVHVAPIRDVLLVTFEPTVVCPLAAVAAFYEISAHAAKRLILAYPGRASYPDRCEVFNSVIEGLRRLDEAANPERHAAAVAARLTRRSPAVATQPRTIIHMWTVPSSQGVLQ
jgi:hypothetical protein